MQCSGFFSVMVSQMWQQEERFRKTKFVIIIGPRDRRHGTCMQGHVWKTSISWAGGKAELKPYTEVSVGKASRTG